MRNREDLYRDGLEHEADFIIWHIYLNTLFIISSISYYKWASNKISFATSHWNVFKFDFEKETIHLKCAPVATLNATEALLDSYFWLLFLSSILYMRCVSSSTESRQNLYHKKQTLKGVSSSEYVIIIIINSDFALYCPHSLNGILHSCSNANGKKLKPIISSLIHI